MGKKNKKTKQRLLLSRLVIYITSVARLNLHLLKCHTELCYYNKPMVSPLARGSMWNTTKVISLTLCWKKDGSRYLSNLSSNFTSDFFHFTWIGEVHWHLCMCFYMSYVSPREYKSNMAYIQWFLASRMFIKKYSQNRTLRFLCLAQVWLCLRWSDLRQRFYCHWSRSLVSYMSTGSALLHFHLPHQQYL